MNISYFDQINDHKYLYLTEYGEPEDNSLLLKIKEAAPDGPVHDLDIGDSKIEGVRSIEVTAYSHTYSIYFESYIGYSVVDESYALPDDYELFEGRLLCVYSQSHFLDYIGKTSFASDDHPGPYRHYGLNCLNHCIEIASCDPPTVKLLSS